MLGGPRVLEAALEALMVRNTRLDLRLLDALAAGAQAGGDSRGLLSAALLVVRRDAAPLTLRVDHSHRPLDDLLRLHAQAMASPYIDWLDHVPTLDQPYRRPAEEGK
ncbi:hypothetical protein PAA8504_03304 [Palleronia abyssalis]|uniref:Uncharacterized protein n=2 Tax=Palleronia abyssalis TaxID=1501240 RepID=A0A2R8BZA8_9RHOB|nr:hypothetical protein PAA8504_03304 [Palleronia abyssalis]